MEIFGEIIIELFIRRLIIGFFGYYTLLLVFKLINNQKKIAWLKEISEEEGEEFGKGCIITLTGFISFSLLVVLIVIIFY